MQLLALAGTDARRWEPKRLRIRLFTVPATLARTGRRRLLHLAAHHLWAAVLTWVKCLRGRADRGVSVTQNRHEPR
jgi:hypothetical protein